MSRRFVKLLENANRRADESRLRAVVSPGARSKITPNR
jgi:hypothetical protein